MKKKMCTVLVVVFLLSVVSSALTLPEIQVSTHEIYDPATDTWSMAEPMPTPRAELVVVNVGGIVYAIGGGIYGESVDANEAYVGEGGWIVKTSLPELLEGAAGAVVDGKVYVLKGHNPSVGDTGDVRIYDPTTDSWSYGTSSTISDAEFYQAGVVSDKIYVIGGRGTFNGNEEYDPLTDTWTSGASMPTGRAGHALAVVDDIVYVIGGRDGSYPLEGNVMNVVEAYDPATDTWITGLATMPTARSDMTSAVVNGEIYVIGGWDGTNILSTVEVYDPFTDTWSSRAAMPTNRADLGAVECSGYIHAIGGVCGLGQGHDVAVTDVTPCKTVVCQNFTVFINVTVNNQGIYTEWFGVVAPYFGGEVIPTPVQWETFWSMGDVNRDGYINQIDLDIIYDELGWRGPPGENPADINSDGSVNMVDFGTCSYNTVPERSVIWTYFGLPLPPKGTQRGVKLYPCNQTTLTFTWNTTGVAKGNYTITAYADQVPGETDTTDNTLTDGWIIVSMIGDITGPEDPPGSGLYPPDGKCDMRDIATIARYFGQNVPPAPPNCDITGPTTGVPDGKIDMRDIATAARHFGEKDP